MVKEDFYTGEPVVTGSPTNFASDMKIGGAAEYEATAMASFGKYDYDPASRPAVSSPVSIYPGRDGYYSGGIGQNPYYSQYGNPQPTYGQYRPQYGAPNPALQPGGFYNYPYYNQSPYYQQQVPTSYHVPGVNMSGEYMPPADYEDQIARLQNEYWRRREELTAEKEVERATQQSYYGGYGYGYNYYGSPFFNSYQYNGINNEITQKARELQDQAREQRLNFMTNLSRLAHNFNHDNISDENINRRYSGKDVEIPQSMIPTYQYNYEQARLESMVPFDNSQVYRDFHASVSREFHKIIPEDSNLKDTFANMGIVAAEWELEEEAHRRRDHTNLYNNTNNAYKHFVRQKAKERYCKEKGITMMPDGRAVNNNQVNNMRQNFMNQSTVLSQNATLADDGTLNVHLKLPYNVGSKRGEMYTVSNSQETEYQEKRERFGRFLDSIPGSIYLDNQKQKKMEAFSDG